MIRIRVVRLQFAIKNIELTEFPKENVELIQTSTERETDKLLLFDRLPIPWCDIEGDSINFQGWVLFPEIPAYFCRPMAKKKLARFAELDTFTNVFQFKKEMKGRWAEHFGNSNPITLELACGKGEYTLGLAQMYPERNFIGIDIKGNRIWRGAKLALDQSLVNVAFLRIGIHHLTDYFEVGEIDEIWITFPDPHLRFSRQKQRLTHPRFLKMYRQICKPDSVINLKTDSDELCAYTLEVIEEEKLKIVQKSNNIYQWKERPPELDIPTYYENRWLAEGKKIKYVSFQQPFGGHPELVSGSPPTDPDTT